MYCNETCELWQPIMTVLLFSSTVSVWCFIITWYD